MHNNFTFCQLLYIIHYVENYNRFVGKTIARKIANNRKINPITMYLAIH